MRFAQILFLLAGTYGLIVLLPMYFLETRTGVDYPPGITHPEFYYGFIGVGVAWQVAFLLIGREPVRFYPLIPAAVLEKLTYAAAVFLLWFQHRVPAAAAPFAAIDLGFGLLFLAAYGKLRRVRSCHGPDAPFARNCRA